MLNELLHVLNLIFRIGQEWRRKIPNNVTCCGRFSGYVGFINASFHFPDHVSVVYYSICLFCVRCIILGTGFVALTVRL